MSAARLLALFAAVVVALPPQWCQALPGAPYGCCDACAEKICEGSELGACDSHKSPKGIGCQCGNTPFKQTEDVVCPAAILPSPISLPSAATVCSVAFLEESPPPLNLQQLLCCWRK